MHLIKKVAKLEQKNDSAYLIKRNKEKLKERMKQSMIDARKNKKGEKYERK